MEVTNSELPQESLIFNFVCRLPENPDNLCLNVVGITPPPKRTITKKIDLCNYVEIDEEDKEKWEVDSDGDSGPFFMTLKTRRSLETIERIMCPWEGRDMLKSKIKLVSFSTLK